MVEAAAAPAASVMEGLHASIAHERHTRVPPFLPDITQIAFNFFAKFKYTDEIMFEVCMP